MKTETQFLILRTSSALFHHSSKISKISLKLFQNFEKPNLLQIMEKIFVSLTPTRPASHKR